jgi:esterase/lipase
VGGIFLRTIKEVEKEMNMVMDTLEKLQEAMTILMYERDNLIAIEKGRQASAEILTEKLIERIKK